jgi:hypothetical protein
MDIVSVCFDVVIDGPSNGPWFRHAQKCYELVLLLLAAEWLMAAGWRLRRVDGRAHDTDRPVAAGRQGQAPHGAT